MSCGYRFSVGRVSRMIIDLVAVVGQSRGRHSVSTLSIPSMNFAIVLLLLIDYCAYYGNRLLILFVSSVSELPAEEGKLLHFFPNRSVDLSNMLAWPRKSLKKNADDRFCWPDIFNLFVFVNREATMGAYIGTVRRSFSKDLAASCCDIFCKYCF